MKENQIKEISLLLVGVLFFSLFLIYWIIK
jgi:hypothetical protein